RRDRAADAGLRDLPADRLAGVLRRADGLRGAVRHRRGARAPRAARRGTHGHDRARPGALGRRRAADAGVAPARRRPVRPRVRVRGVRCAPRADRRAVKMDVAAVALWLLVAVAALVCLAAGAMAFHLRASDAAGNGLAQAYLACTLGLCWLLVGVLLLVAGLRAPHPSAGDPSWTWIGRAALVLFLVAIGGQAAGFAALCTARDSGLLRVLL